MDKPILKLKVPIDPSLLDSLANGLARKPLKENKIEKVIVEEKTTAEPIAKETIKKIKRRKPIDKEKYNEMLTFLQANYPSSFSMPRPLAVGIHNELNKLHNQEFSKTIIRKFLAKYCNSLDYRKTLKIGEPRINLDGNITSTVIAEEIPNVVNKRVEAAKHVEKPSSEAKVNPN